jgi:O-acetyl-ADP-ribose deacetylase (regulator of RNase III)
MLKYKVGDLIEAAKSGEVHVIAHCCNCLHSMASGIAPLIKEAFPYAYEADLETAKADPKKLGTVSYGIAEPEDWTDTVYCPDVFNLYGQYSYTKRRTGGRDLNYDALYDSLVAMTKKLNEWGTEKLETRIGLPMLGAGLANGDWDIIEMMIKKTLCSAGFNVTIYTLN